MSEENKSNLTTTVAVVLIAMFTVVWGGWVTSIGPSDTNNTETVATTATSTELVEVSAEINSDGIVEEIVVIADPTNLPSDEELDITEVTTAEIAE